MRFFSSILNFLINICIFHRSFAQAFMEILSTFYEIKIGEGEGVDIKSGWGSKI